MRQRGIFISFEGSEGCGKSTQIQKLAEILKCRGQPFLLAREPGGTAIGEQIRHLLKYTTESTTPLCPEAELLLFAASRAQLVREVIRPALLAGSMVICDRFLDSTTIYQGIARGLPHDFVECVNQYAVEDCFPNITFLLDMDSTLALKRAVGRRTPQELHDRMEQESPQFYERVRQGYLERAREAPERFVILDAAQTADSLSQTIVKILEERWPFLC